MYLMEVKYKNGKIQTHPYDSILVAKEKAEIFSAFSDISKTNILNDRKEIIIKFQSRACMLFNDEAWEAAGKELQKFRKTFSISFEN